MVPLAAGPYCSLLVQRKVGKRKHTPAVRPPLRGGFAVPAGIFVRAILAHTKTAHVLCAAPLGFDPPGLPDLRGPREPELKILRARFCLCFGVPMRRGEWAG
ncbi:hypothetical protein FB548_3575 [Pseudoxanthomonas sp. 3HH-4]|nr:hypothetical protein FB548_3575 [Pseudoxanthomonas sp. 3HH-4]